MKFRILNNFKFLALLIIFQTYSQNEFPDVEFEEIIINDDDGLQSWENLDHIYEDNDGVFWTSINEGVFRYNGHTAVNVSSYLSTKYGLNLDSQTSTKILKENNILWIGRRKSLLKLDLQNFTKKEIVLDSALHAANYRNLINEITVYKDTLYVGTGNGLYLVDKHTTKVIKKYLNDGVDWLHTSSSNGVESMLLDVEKNAIWLALNSGLYRIDKITDTIEHYTFADKSLKYKHHFLEGYHFGDNLLFTSWGVGLVKFNLKTKLFRVIRNEPSTTEKWSKEDYWDNNIVRSQITINDSISLVNFQRFGNAYFNRNTEIFTFINTPEEMKQGVFFNIDRSGYLWCSKIGRLWRSKKPIVALRKPFKHVLDVSSFKTNNILQTIPGLEGYETIELGEERNVSIEFGLTKPYLIDSIHYEYKLNKKDWTLVSNILNLNNLSNKTHTLRLRALDQNHNILAQRELSFHFNIPFYKTNTFLISGVLFLFTIAFFISQYFQSKRTSKRIIELDKIKSSFFANISHEFRTPLALISSSLQNLSDDNEISNKQKDHFNMIERNSDRLLTLVNQLLDLSKIEAGALKIRAEKGNISNLIKTLSEAFIYPFQQKGITYIQNINLNQEYIWFDKDAIEKIITNLLSNALKYTPSNGKVTFNCELKDEIICINILNTGKGLTSIELKKIFERFYRTEEDKLGSGIGLALIKEIVDLYKGKIDVKSELNKWTSFTVILPTNKPAFKHIKSAQNVKDKYKYIDEIVEQNQQSELPILLIVEDNIDVQQILKNIFNTDYRVYATNNGQEGVELALKQIPDIIISDVMMPVKDGISLVKDLKNNTITSHIPIILLTAKVSDEDELIGINSGADDYIAKPFNNKLLKAKVDKLIETRQDLQKKYSEKLIFNPKDITVTNLDIHFFEKIQSVFDEKLEEPSFNVEEFSVAVGMSRMQLHRKLKALTGLSASEFIRSQRLKLAADLLQKSDINISQVGYTVGFNDHSYFTKCFKELYGVTPSEYVKNN